MPADLKAMYEGILAAAGGAENITTLGCCMTRLRFTVKTRRWWTRTLCAA